MTPLDLQPEFLRDMGCTEVEFGGRLQEALPGGLVELRPDGQSASVRFPDGELWLKWSELPTRRIALLQVPRLQVSFEYIGLTPERRFEVQRHFDLVFQRGGG